MNKELGIYVHVPFCIRKCAYCDFYSGPYDEEKGARYFDALLSEIREAPGRFRTEGYTVNTVYIGGGTPSAVPPAYVAAVLGRLRDCFSFAADTEISMEANPGTLTQEKLRCYREAGVNRLSIGLQSTEDRLLKTLGRIHDLTAFMQSFDLAREAGFQNINVDLISGIPGQRLTDWENSLVSIAELEPEHLSAYSLIIEEGTPFYALYGEQGSLRSALPSEEEERAMYQRTEEILDSYGYSRYEISNYAKKGYECRHNLGTWSLSPYLGFGAAAASFFENRRLKNAESLTYRDFPQTVEEILTPEEEQKEYMLLGLRKTAGVDDGAFQERFGASLFSCFEKEIGELTHEGLLHAAGTRVFLTKRGLDLANQVFFRFV